MNLCNVCSTFSGKKVLTLIMVLKRVIFSFNYNGLVKVFFVYNHLRFDISLIVLRLGLS